jgi:hypothetical protein
LLVIMTPHVVRSRTDIERVLGEEAHRMDWIMGDVLRTHGTYGMDPVMPKKDGPGGRGGPGAEGGACQPAVPGAGIPEGPAPIPVPGDQLTPPRVVPQPGPGSIPPAQPMTGAPGQPQAFIQPQPAQLLANNSYPNAGTTPGYSQNAADAQWSNPNMQAPQGYATQPQTPAAPVKENRGWSLFNRQQ